MDGDSTSSGGHSHTGAQSKSDGHSTLNENSTDASSGSKPAGGSSLPPPATSRSVYVEKSPRESVRTSSTVAGSSSPATSFGSSPAGSGVAGAAHSTFTGIRSPPSISTFDVPSPAAGFSSRTNSVRWRRSFDGASES